MLVWIGRIISRRCFLLGVEGPGGGEWGGEGVGMGDGGREGGKGEFVSKFACEYERWRRLAKLSRI